MADTNVTKTEEANVTKTEEAKVDKTEKPKEVITGDNVFDVIINRAVEQARKNFPKQVASISDDKDAEPKPFSIDEYMDRMYSKFTEKDLNSQSGFNPEMKDAAIATTQAAKAMYVLCVASELKKSMNDVLRDSGMSRYIRDNVRQDINKHIDGLMNEVTSTEIGKKLVETLEKTYSDYSDSRDGIQRFLNQGMNYLDEVNKNMFDKNMAPKEAIAAAKNGSDSIGQLDKGLAAGLSTALEDFTQGSKNAINMMGYPERNGVTAESFLKHYKENPANLTAEEKKWANDILRTVANEVMQKSGKTNTVLYPTNFYIDGKPAVSDAEMQSASRREIDPAMFDCKIVAAMISGNDTKIGVPEMAPPQKQATASVEKATADMANQRTASTNQQRTASSNQRTATPNQRTASSYQHTANPAEKRNEASSDKRTPASSAKKAVPRTIKVNSFSKPKKLENLFDLVIAFLAALLNVEMEKKSSDIEMSDLSAESTEKKATQLAKRERMTFNDLVKENGGVEKRTAAPKKTMQMDKDKTKAINPPSMNRR